MPSEIEISRGAIKNLKKLDRKTIARPKETIDEIAEGPLSKEM